MDSPFKEALPRNFFDADVETVAKALIGVSVFTLDPKGNRTGGMIVETEAYDQNDFSAHCYCPDGKRTKKLGAAEAMFLSAGHTYFYYTRSGYCVNFVCGEEGFGSAVLIRALMPEIGIDIMRERRIEKSTFARLKDDELFVYSLCNGPACLGVALGINKNNRGQFLYDPPFELRLNNIAPQIIAGARVGLKDQMTRKHPNRINSKEVKDAIERPWRWGLIDSPFLSRPFPLAASKA